MATQFIREIITKEIFGIKILTTIILNYWNGYKQTSYPLILLFEKKNASCGHAKINMRSIDTTYYAATWQIGEPRMKDLKLEHYASDHRMLCRTLRR